MFPAGWTLEVTANLQYRTGLAAGTTVGNGVTATSDRPFEQCEYTEDAVLQEPTTGLVDKCTATTHVTVNASAPISMRKLVKGVGAGDPDAAPGSSNYDDLGVLAYNQADAGSCSSPADSEDYYAFPCVPITRPGGLERWKLTFANEGNVPANVVAGIDTLPQTGDTGVTIGTQRGSRWTPTLVGDFESVTPAGADLQVLYSTTVPTLECNEADILDETTPGGIPESDPCYADVSSREWLPTAGASEAELASARALKVVLTYDDPAAGLAPGASGQLSFLTRTPWVSPVADPATTDPIAWNAVAAGSRRAFTSDTYPQAPSLVVEPQKVGVALASGELDLAKVVVVDDDFPAELPDAYPVRLDCTSGPGRRRPARSGRGHGREPCRSSCGRDGRPIQQRPQRQPAVVLRLHGRRGPGGARSDGHHRPGLGDRPARLHRGREHRPPLRCRHRSRAAHGDQHVRHGRLHGQQGRGRRGRGGPGRQPDRLRHRLRLHGQLHLPRPGGRARGPAVLHPGRRRRGDGHGSARRFGVHGHRDRHRRSGLHVGHADPGRRRPGHLGRHRRRVHDRRCGHRDHRGVHQRLHRGSVSITKEVAGSGADAWGNEDFELRLVCTLTDADPETVYDATHIVSKDEPTWQVDDLPTGASCEFTEPETGGANDTALPPPPSPVGDEPEDDPLELTATNTFTEGSLAVAKALTLDGEPTTDEPFASGTTPSR